MKFKMGLTSKFDVQVLVKFIVRCLFKYFQIDTTLCWHSTYSCTAVTISFKEARQKMTY